MLAKNKLRALRSLVHRHDIILLQGVHGAAEDMERLRHTFRQTHDMNYAAGASRDSGGYINLIRENAPSNAVWSMNVPARVRALFSSVVSGEDELHIGNIRNFAFSPNERMLVKAKMLAIQSHVRLKPTRRLFLMMGDWNCPATGEFTNRSLTNGNISRSRTSHFEKKRWLPVLRELTELSHKNRTRFGGVHHSVFTRIDRICTSLPAWTLKQIQAHVCLAWQATSPSGLELSDHAPVSGSLSSRKQLPKELRPIPLWLASSKASEEAANKLALDAHVEALGPWERLLIHKKSMRKASEVALDHIMNRTDMKKERECQAISSAARAAWFDIPALVPQIHKNAPETIPLLEIQDGHVVITNPERFKTLVGQATRRHLHEELRLANINTPRSTKKRSSHCHSILRMRKMCLLLTVC
jgi:endonuclease/exonuclease/phosphatase family metal-dependent hydrolase